MNKASGWTAVVIGTLTAALPTCMLFQAVTYLFVVPLVLGVVCVILGAAALRSNGWYARHAGSMAVILMLIGVMLPVGLISYHNRSGYPIVLVVSEGYRGRVKLIIDRQRGIDVPVVDGKYTYRIPETGTLVINDGSPFRHWHSMTAKYASGKFIPIDYQRILPADAVSLHSLGSGVTTRGGKQESYIEYFVGTKAEFTR